ncbi:MAG: DUF2608 domain-containing protein [Parachlamydiales bacterium]|jgi:FMN phosphatase YigB (HAD superfamily)
MRSLLYFFSAFICIFSGINAEIHHCKTIQEVLPHFEQTTANTLVIFDLDDTLITKTDKVLRPAAKDYHMGCYFKLIQKVKFDHIVYLISIVEKFAQPELVDASWPSIIADLQKITPYVMAHTAAFPKKMGIFENFPEARKQVLNALGIDFTPISSHYSDAELKELGHIPNVHPVFYSGMLFSENYAKGEALGAFISHYGSTPDRVIFVDDHTNNLRSVEKELTKRGIPFTGIHFEESTLFSDTYNEDIAAIQYYYLVEKNEWKNDEEAAHILDTDGVPDEPVQDGDDDDGDDNEEIWSF